MRVLSGLKAGATDVLSQVDAEPVLYLVAALGDADAVIRENALTVLQRLQNPKGVDALCGLWAQKRDERLGQIIAQRKYVATAPAQVRVLSGLKAGATDVLSQVDAEPVPYLVGALGDADAVIRENALTVLQRLQNPKGVDALCGLWAQKRDERLGQIIAQRKYVASEPWQIRCLTALKCGRRVAVEGAEVVSLVAQFLGEPDQTIQAQAAASLEQVGPGPAQDALCDIAIRDPKGPAAALCKRAGKRPSDPERLCLFLFVTEQLDEYAQEDHEFQSLRLEYERADATVREHVLRVAGSGDLRAAGFFSKRRKPLVECTEAEVEGGLQSWLRHEEWSQLFQACLELPLRKSLPLLAALRASGWEPVTAGLRSAYRQMLADAPDQAPAAEPPPASSLFAQWLAAGREGDRARASESELRSRLQAAAPPDGVTIVGVLAAKATLDAATVQAVQSSPHWLVRLAGYAAGILRPDLAQDSIEDSNYWVAQLGAAHGLLDFWPGRSTRADIDTLNAAPPEAWLGKPGAARKVLRRILDQRHKGGTFTQVVIEVDERAGTFRPADRK